MLSMCVVFIWCLYMLLVCYLIAGPRVGLIQ